MVIENKRVFPGDIISGRILSCKQIDRNGIPVGIIEMYMATWDLDRDKDVFVKGAFKKAIDRHKSTGRQVRLKDGHGRTIGGVPINTVLEDEKGLFGIGEVNLELQLGREVYSLVKQRVLTDMSVGYSAIDCEYKENIRYIKESELWECSIVDEPANVKANITSVKNINHDTTGIMAYATTKWEPSDAQARVRAWAGEDDDKYAKAFLYSDGETEYKFQVSDIINGELKVIPRAVIAARVSMSLSHGLIDSDAEEIKQIINGYYKRLKLDQPFTGGTVRPFCITEINNMSKSILASVIRYCELSKDAASYVAQSALPAIMGEREKFSDLDTGIKKLLDNMQNIKNNFRS